MIEIKSFNEENKKRVSKIIFHVLNDFSNYPHKVLKRIIKDMLWSATEDDDNGDSMKYFVPIWSDMAIEHQNTWFKTKKDLRHEHMYPKGLLYDFFFTKKNVPQKITYDEVLYLIKSFSHSAVIHKNEEDNFRKTKNGEDREENLVRKIPKKFKDADNVSKLFSRYIIAEIELRVIEFDKDLNVIPIEYILKKEGNKLMLPKFKTTG